MKTMAAGTFKARCLQVIEQVRMRHQPVLITRRGKPIAKLVPVEKERRSTVFGSMRGKIEIRGDIVAPVLPKTIW